MKLVRTGPAAKYARMPGTELRKRCNKGERGACKELAFRRDYPGWAAQTVARPERFTVGASGPRAGPGRVTDYGPWGAKRRKVKSKRRKSKK